MHFRLVDRNHLTAAAKQYAFRAVGPVSAMGWIIIFVAIFQKQIMEGIMAGGVKG